MAPKKVTAKEKLGTVKVKPRPTTPVWQGPNGDGPQGGVTFSLLSRYLTCRERFRILTIEGLKPHDKLNDRIEFGNCWHILEEALASERRHFGFEVGTALGEDNLGEYVAKLHKRFPRERDTIILMAEKCWALFGAYQKYWHNHPDVVNRQPLLQEQPFDVPYELPSGRKVRLRGKWDSVDLIQEPTAKVIRNKENKTKSKIDLGELQRQLSFDLQTMIYLIALQEDPEQGGALDTANHLSPNRPKLVGVCYNVVRRSTHKSAESMMKKVEEDIADKRDGEWFARFNVDLLPNDIPRFKRECLDPVLENLYDDWEWWQHCYIANRHSVFDEVERRVVYEEHRNRHFRFPYGIYNPLTEGGQGEVDAYLQTGSEAGLQRVTDLFPELPNADRR